jgi:3-hydroxyisobutyrate dehydrogenase-like beta-hydroxyacid dehydrogenase
MGKRIFHCGGPGTGEIAKIANNLILGIQMIAASEGMVLGEKLGIDPKTLMEILSVSTSSCWSITTANPRPGNIETAPASKNYEGGFQVGLIRKDLALALECADKVGAKLEFGEEAMEYYRHLEKKGHGGKDFGYVFQYIMKDLKI